LLQSGATPRRAVVGWDGGRLAMLLAVLEARCGLNFSSAEVYLNVAGGYRLTDPAADLAVAAALVSALADKPLPLRSLWFGEVSLAGEIRPVAHAGLRLREGAKLGFESGYGPDGADGGGALRYTGLSALPAFVNRVVACTCQPTHPSPMLPAGHCQRAGVALDSAADDGLRHHCASDRGRCRDRRLHARVRAGSAVAVRVAHGRGGD